MPGGSPLSPLKPALVVRRCRQRAEPLQAGRPGFPGWWPAPGQHRRHLFHGRAENCHSGAWRVLDAGHEIVGVYTQPSRTQPAAGFRLRKSPCSFLAEVDGLPVLHAAKPKSPSRNRSASRRWTDAASIVAYRLILPKAVAEAPLAASISTPRFCRAGEAPRIRSA